MRIVVPIAVTDAIGGGFDVITNGTFGADTDWTKGAGWTIGSGTANASAGATSEISQTAIFRVGGTFNYSFDVSGRTAGGVTPIIGGVTGSQETTNGTFTGSIVAGGSDLLVAIEKDAAFDGSIDNFIVTQEFSNVTDSARAEWSVGTGYSINDPIKVSFEIDGTTPITPREFTAATAHSGQYPPNFADTTIPVPATPDWTEDEATNRFKMFDQLNGSQTENADSVDVVVTPLEIINSVAALNIFANTLQVIVTDPSEGVVYDRTVELISNSGIIDWHAYYFTPIQRQTDVVLTDLPSYSQASTAAILAESGTTVKVGVLVFGSQKFIGTTDYGTSIGIINYSVKTEDANGNFVITKRTFSKRADYVITLETGTVADIQNFLTSILDTPAVWIGDEDFGSTLIYGYYRDFDIFLSGPQVSDGTIIVEGLA